ncbi:MAG: hypothetical protein IPM07_25580 [Anaerolineales bacterium]|nr:hypothetical protein [Anaerolineales bacterium]
MLYEGVPESLVPDDVAPEQSAVLDGAMVEVLNVAESDEVLALARASLDEFLAMLDTMADTMPTFGHCGPLSITGRTAVMTIAGRSADISIAGRTATIEITECEDA